MTDQAASTRLELLVFSDDATVRQDVIDGVGRRPAEGRACAWAASISVTTSSAVFFSESMAFLTSAA